MNEFVEKVSQKIHKLSNEQLEQVLLSITSENRILDSIWESLNSGLIILDNDWTIMRLNKAAERMIPFSTHHLEDNKSPIWDLILEDNICAFIKSAASQCKSNNKKEFSVTYGEKIMFIDMTLQPLLADNEIEGTIILVNDITSSKQEEILLHRMENLQSLTQLAASVAHEIKNPLGAISIHIQLLQKSIKKAREGDGSLPDEKFLEKYIDVVNEEIDSLNKIVLDFLFAVRPVQARMELLNPNDLISRSVQFFKVEFESKNIEVTTKLDENCPLLLLDSKLFKEVIVNLFKNAMEALEKRESGKEIVIKSEVKKDKVYITIGDNGCGMSRETCRKIFEPYYTTRANGTGLGLTTVYKIIKEFNGDINVTSEIDRGTIFKISLPIPQEKNMLLSDNSDTTGEK